VPDLGNPLPAWSLIGYAAAHSGGENVFDSLLNSACANERDPSDQTRKRFRLVNALLEAHPIFETPSETAVWRAAKSQSHKPLSAVLKVIQKCLLNLA
jgi:hypothetical protein